MTEITNISTHAWYNNLDVKYNLIKFLKNREMALLVPSWCPKEEQRKNVRTLKAHSTQHIDFILKALSVREQETRYNFYYSLAKYRDGIPNQTLNFNERDNDDWKKNHYKEMISYDFLLDIDSPDHENISYAYESTKEIKALFDKLNVPYELRFSGCGFHFIIPYEYFIDLKLSFMPNTLVNIYRFYSKIAKELNKRFSEMIDVKIYDSRRVCKIPYSLSLYEKQNYMCFPFRNNEQFKIFGLKNMRPEKWFTEIKNRGTFFFNPEGNIYKLLEYLNIEKP